MLSVSKGQCSGPSSQANKLSFPDGYWAMQSSFKPRTRLFNAIQTTSPSHLQLTERKSFKLVYSGLVWLVIPLIMIGLQVIGRGAGWMDKPNAQDLAGQAGKANAFITMAFKATHFITQNLPEFLWIPTGILISALSSWLLWKIIRKDTNELVLTKPNPEQFNLTAANP